MIADVICVERQIRINDDVNGWCRLLQLSEERHGVHVPVSRSLRRKFALSGRAVHSAPHRPPQCSKLRLQRKAARLGSSILQRQVSAVNRGAILSLRSENQRGAETSRGKRALPNGVHRRAPDVQADNESFDMSSSKDTGQ